MQDNTHEISDYDSFEMSLSDINSTGKEPTTGITGHRRRRRTANRDAATIGQTGSEVGRTDYANSEVAEKKDHTVGVEANDKHGRRNNFTTKNRRNESSGYDDTSTPISMRRRFRIFNDSRLSIFLGVVLTLFSAYTFLCSLSFIAKGNADQAIVDGASFYEISSRSTEVSNTGGPIGAILSDFLLSRWFGIGTFVLIAYLMILSVSLLRLRPCKFWSLTFKSLISTVAVSVIAGALCYHSAHLWYWGGEHGYYVNEFLLKNTGIWGDIFVNVILFTLLVLLFFDTLTKIFRYIVHTYNSYRERLNRQALEATKAPVPKEEVPRRVEESRIPDCDGAVKIEVNSIPVHTESESSNNEPEPDTELSDPISEISEQPPVQENSTELPANDKTLTVVKAEKIEEARKIDTDCYDPTAELSRYKLPPISLLREIPQKSVSVDEEEQEENKLRIIRTLNSYGIEIQSIRATVGPTITLYEIVPAEGVRISKIKNLGNDMALSLSALGIRIIAPIPGQGTIGVEVPNKDKQIVSIRSILSSASYQNSTAALPIAMGTTITNEVYVSDLAKMPHLLVAGATGMGKSVGLNTIIASLLYKKHPAELKFVLIDPKMVEFSLYSVLERHFLAKLPDEEDAIITDTSKVMATLNSLCLEMENRYELLRKAGVRDIKSYNAKFVTRSLSPEKGHRYLPYIVVIVDEFADLILTAGKEIEPPISRIAAKARAIGIHMILATQRPSVDVITGVIKANFPGRIAFRVNQMNDSRTILDRPGADQLIGRGDMIISKDGVMERVQCALIETEEVEAICNFISHQIGYLSAYELPEYIPPTENSGFGSTNGGGERDSLFVDAGRFIIESGVGSTTAIQRHFNVGFPRAGKIMDQLERAGVVGPSVGGKPRKLLMDNSSFEDLVAMM